MPPFPAAVPWDHTRIQSPLLGHVVLPGHWWLILARVSVPHHLVWDPPWARAVKSTNPKSTLGTDRGDRLGHLRCVQSWRPSTQSSLKLHRYPWGPWSRPCHSRAYRTARVFYPGVWGWGTETNLEMHAPGDGMRMSQKYTGDALGTHTRPLLKTAWNQFRVA